MKVSVVFVVQVQDCFVPSTYTLIVPVTQVIQLEDWKTMVSFVVAPVTDPVKVRAGVPPNELDHVRFVRDMYLPPYVSLEFATARHLMPMPNSVLMKSK